MSPDVVIERPVSLRVTGLVLDLPGIDNPSPVSFEVAAGSSLAVSGPSGTGKTSLLAVLAGLAAPAAGDVSWGRAPITTSDDAHRRRVGYVQQGYGLVATLTAVENVAVPLLGRSADADAWALARAALAEMALDDQADQLVDRMSGGQQQRVAVARALAADPVLILADEPTSELDAATRALVLEALFQRNHLATLVIATHDPDVAARCDQQLQLRTNTAPSRRGRHRADSVRQEP